jgi:hypothetical protein
MTALPAPTPFPTGATFQAESSTTATAYTDAMECGITFTATGIEEFRVGRRLAGLKREDFSAAADGAQLGMVIGLVLHHPVQGGAIGAGGGLVASYIDRTRRHDP